MPAEYTLEIAGTEYPWVDIRYIRDFKFFGKLIEAIIPEWVAAIAGNDAIVIKREGATVTSGKVKKVAPFEGIGKGMGMVVTGYTKEQRHATLLVNARTYNADPHDIIIDDLGGSDLTDGTTNPYGSNIVVEFGSNDEAKFSRKAVYEEVAFITGWELYVNPSGALDFKSQCGVDRSASVTFKHGELLEKWHKPHMLNHLVKKTKVIVLGACEAEFEYYGIAGAGTDVYTIQRKNLIDDNTCTLAAAAVYADIQNILKVGAMDVIDTYVGAAYDVYDTVRVTDARFGLDENVRIYRIERHIDKKGEHTRIFYTNITKLTCNGPFLLDLASGELAAGQRILRDLARVRHSGSYLGAGTSFPTTRLVTGDTFQLTADIPSTHLAAFYQYDDATSTWNRQPAQFRRASNPTYGQLEGDLNENTTDGMIYQWTGSAWLRKTVKHTEGTSLPSSGMINGDTFYHTSQKLLYTYDGSSWGDPVTRSHDSLTDVGGSDHHSVFTSGGHAVVDHTSDMLKKGVQPFHSNVEFSPKTGAKHNQVQWTAGVVKFADESTQNISLGNTTSAIPDGEVRYIYFTVGSTSLTVTTDYGDTIGDNVGILAVVGTSVDPDHEQEIFIQPFYSKGLNIIADVLAANCILGVHITATEWIESKKFRTAETGARIEFDGSGIIGMDASDNARFYISNDGRAYFATGLIALDEDGMNVNSGDVIIDSSGIKIFGETLKLYDTNEVLRGSIFGVTTGCLSIYTPGWILLNPSSDGVKLNTGPLFPGADGVQSLGKSGASPVRFRYYTPRSILASRPAASINTVGLFWATRETGAYKEKLWVCMQNDASGYEWVQIGVST